MKKKNIQYGEKVPVVLKKAEHEYILKETLIEPEAFGNGILEGDKMTFHLSLDEIEYIQGFIAAEANHAKNRKVEDRLDNLYDKMQKYLDKYDDQQGF